MRLLLAEDEEDLSRALVTVLKHNNYSVDAVYDGAEALDYLENGDNYDGVILDIMMPKMDGITVLKTIRRHGNSVPVVLLTAKAEIDDRVEGLDSGADDYLPKPFSMKELLARIRAMTRRQTDTTDNVLAFGDIALNRSTYQLTGRRIQKVSVLLARNTRCLKCSCLIQDRSFPRIFLWIKSGVTIQKRNKMSYGYIFPI